MIAASTHQAAAKSPPAPAHQSTDLVALLIWTYQRQKADVMSGRGLWTPEVRASADLEPSQGWSGCGCAQLEAVAALGVRIEPGGWQRPALHPDAELVHDLVVELSRTDWVGATLLRRHGRQGDMPDWGAGPQVLEPVRDGRDRIVQDRYDEVVTIRDAAGRERVVPVPYCPVQRFPSDEWLDMIRGEYRHWFAALRRLAAMLSRPADGRRLSRWTVSGLGTTAEPWA